MLLRDISFFLLVNPSRLSLLHGFFCSWFQDHNIASALHLTPWRIWFVCTWDLCRLAQPLKWFSLFKSPFHGLNLTATQIELNVIWYYTIHSQSVEASSKIIINLDLNSRFIKEFRKSQLNTPNERSF